MTYPFTDQDITLAREAWELGYEWEWGVGDGAGDSSDLLPGIVVSVELFNGCEWLRLDHAFGQTAITAQFFFPIPLPHQVEAVMRRLGWEHTDKSRVWDIWCNTQLNKQNMKIGIGGKSDKNWRNPLLKAMHPSMVTRYLLALVAGLKRREK